MNNTEINRQIVQDGLDRRAEERARRDADLEAQARKLRIIINYNHIAKTNPQMLDHIPVSTKAQSNIQDHLNVEDADDTEEEYRYCTGWYRFLFRVFLPLMIASAILSFSASGTASFLLTAPFAIVFCLISIGGFAARYLHHE